MERLHQLFRKIYQISRNQAGVSLVELLLAIGLAGALMPALLTGFVTSRQGKVQQESRTDAIAYLRESQEAVRSVRERGWTSFAVNGTYHPATSSGTWALQAGAETINSYTRSIVIDDVYRDTSGVIATSGGTLDPSTKKVTMTVGWDTPYSSQISATLYVTRYLENLSYLQTTTSEFNTGTKNLVNVTTTSDGEISLAQNTRGQWCQPNLSLSSLDLPGVPNAVTAIEGHVYASTGQVAQASETSFAHVVVANNVNPPTSQLAGIIKGYKSNAVFGESSWAYLATTDNSKEIVIIDLNAMDDPVNKIYTQSGTFNTPSNSTDADTIFVHNNRGYMTSGQYLYVFDLSSKTGSRAQIGTRISFANSGDTAGEIYVVTVGTSTYAYVSVIGSTPEELKILNVTNHNNSSTWRVVGAINIEPNNCSSLESGQAVYVKPDGSRAYIASVNDTNFKEFFVINTSSKTSPSLVGGFASNPPCTNGGGYEAGGMDPRQSVVVSLAENRAILVGIDALGGANSEEYQVLDLSSESTPTKCGGMQFDQGIYGVASVKEVDGDAYSYIITGDGAAELKIVQGGSDGLYNESGNYESAIFDAGYTTAFNRFTATATVPANTTLQYQFAVADAVSGSCTGASYVYTGPDGTSGTYYSGAQAAIALQDNGSGYENPGRCFRYKAFFTTTDFNVTPVLENMTVNYSP